MYVDFLNDPKMVKLAFEDQRHFIGLLALKSDGALDDENCDPDLLDRIVAQRLWIDHAVIREVKKRLVASGLIDDNWQPVAWDRRQFPSDSSTDRTRKYRERQGKKLEAGGETSQERHGDGADTDADTDTDAEEQKALAPEGAQDNPPEPPAEETKPEKPAKGKSTADPPPLTIDDLVSEGVDRQHASDWLKVRRAKKAPLTTTAWDGLKAEAEKAGITPAEAVRIAAGESWQGFKAAWYARMQQEERGRGGGGRDANGRAVAATSQQRSFKGVQYSQGRVDPLFEDLEEATNL